VARQAPTYAYVTEMPGNQVAPEQIDMIVCRYTWAARLAAGKDVLEVACGPGIGLGALSARARRLVAGDYDRRCLDACRAHYGSRVPLLRLNAEHLPFPDESFDLVLMFEAIYYLARPERFCAEARRILRPGGRLLLALPNRDWPGFAPSPESHRYFSPAELAQLGAGAGFAVAVYGCYPQARLTTAQRLLRLVRRAATVLGLVPKDPGKTEAVRRVLKRLAYRRLAVLPPEISVPLDSPCRMTALPLAQADRLHRVFYAELRAP
jgi:SAM-dependent methyltransferase